MSKTTKFSGTQTINLDIEVEFEYDGCYDPGNTYGPPENCYPPERELNVNVTGIRIDGIKNPIGLTPDGKEAIEMLIVEKIDNGEIEAEND